MLAIKPEPFLGCLKSCLTHKRFSALDSSWFIRQQGENESALNSGWGTRPFKVKTTAIGHLSGAPGALPGAGRKPGEAPPAPSPPPPPCWKGVHPSLGIPPRSHTTKMTGVHDSQHRYQQAIRGT